MRLPGIQLAASDIVATLAAAPRQGDCGQMRMMAESEHSACVDAWLAKVSPEPSAEGLVVVFEAGFEAVWSRAYQTLGTVTLVAIARRVLHVASERFPCLAALEVESTGLSCDELRADARQLEHAELEEGLRYLLVELLRLLGSLTAGILTPALHAALSEARAPSRTHGDGDPRRDPRCGPTNREDAK